jgi:DnaA family protein
MNNHPLPYQLPLPLGFNEEQGFAQFYAGVNAESVGHLRRFLSAQDETLIFLWGERGLGKTHLLQACCQEAHHLGLSLSYLPLATLLTHGIGILEGIEQQQLVCLDDIDVAAGHTDWEHALFDTFNRIRDTGHRLLVTASQPPAELAIGLPDLKTRLGWGLTLMLKPLNDAEKLQALGLRAHNLGLTLEPAVGRFLLAHYRRDLLSLFELLHRLDRASLAAKRRLTLPFVKSYLENQSST